MNTTKAIIKVITDGLSQIDNLYETENYVDEINLELINIADNVTKKLNTEISDASNTTLYNKYTDSPTVDEYLKDIICKFIDNIVKIIGEDKSHDYIKDTMDDVRQYISKDDPLLNKIIIHICDIHNIYIKYEIQRIDIGILYEDKLTKEEVILKATEYCSNLITIIVD